MPNSPLKPNPEADVQAFLEDALLEKHISETVVDQNYRPLLFLRVKNVLAAFAFSNADFEKSYEVLYSAFKQHYIEQKGQWDPLDLSFVFCVQQAVPQLDKFCASVETDVYFCRKFVILLRYPLGPSLARLPFLPLAKLAGQSLRPPSAQTFLQQCGMPAALARNLVVQKERGPEGILEDCTTDKYGKADSLGVSSSATEIRQQREAKPVRLEKLEIHNFRAYRQSQTFWLGADITFLYGPNGFGKTSFFDAIDFAVTGGIGRLESRRQSDFETTARHLDAESEDSTVTLTFKSNDTLRKISRTVNDRKHAMLDDKPTERKAILTQLTSGNIPSADRVENFVRLFRASHLFSQEQQELTKDFQDDCKISSEIVSRMLAFEDYTNATVKVNRVREVLRGIVTGTAEQIKLLRAQIATESQELERLGNAAKAHSNTEVLKEQLDELRAQLRALGIAAAATMPDVPMVRGWRAALESKHSQSRMFAERLSVIAKEMVELPLAKADIEETNQQIKHNEATLKDAEDRRIGIEIKIKETDQRLAEMTSKRVEEQARADLHKWIRNVQPSYLAQISLQKEMDSQLRLYSDEIDKLTQAKGKAAEDLSSKENVLKQLADLLQDRRAKTEAAQAFLSRIPSHDANRTQLSALLSSDIALRNELERLRREEAKLAPALFKANSEEKRLVKEIADADRNQTELRKLVSQLQGHVNSGTCPLCGEDHGATERLLKRIQNHVAIDAASGARAELSSLRIELKKLADISAVNNQEQQSSNSQLERLKNEKIRLQNEIADFARAASIVGISISEDHAQSNNLAQAQVSQLQQEVTKLGESQREAAIALAASRGDLDATTNSLNTKKGEFDSQKSAQTLNEKEIVRLRSDPRLSRISLDIAPGELDKLEQLNQKNIKDIHDWAAKAESDSNKNKTELLMVRHEIAALKTQVTASRNKVGNLNAIVSQASARLHDADMPVDSNEESIRAAIAEQARLQTQMLELRETTSGLELAIDAATTSAALTTIQQSVRKHEKIIAEATIKRERHLPWVQYFDGVLRLLSTQQDSAIENFTRQYGPRATVIQRRLRPVYGFEEIDITSEKSEISVRVKRRGKELHPTDYFSQSQQQTLLLGLFLTACSSQTWSTFAPVFLDDPVTHFDDLNTYALLDLLSGLLESEVEQRQFIISTCDEKLFQLARQKFRHFGDRAKYYQFTSIGTDGPSVAELV